MRYVRKAAQQAHPVPTQAYRPGPIFSPEVMREPVVTLEYVPQPDGGGIEIPEGATAQNDYRPPRAFICRLCEATVMEPDLAAHWCEGMA